jgi:hypothetical protein
MSTQEPFLTDFSMLLAVELNRLGFFLSPYPLLHFCDKCPFYGVL